MRKILYSPGFGAGWSTWMHNIPKEFSTQYQPIIDALENDEELTQDHPAIQQFIKECQEKYGEDPYIGSNIENLDIYKVPNGVAVRISEYDGNERVHLDCNEEYF